MRNLVERDYDRHLNMLLHPERWPYDPILPVKRGDGDDPELGLVFALEGVAVPTVYLCNLFFLKQANTAPKFEYPDLPSLLAAGWEVD